MVLWVTGNSLDCLMFFLITLFTSLDILSSQIIQTYEFLRLKSLTLQLLLLKMILFFLPSIPVVDIVSSLFTCVYLISPTGLYDFQGKVCILNSFISASKFSKMLCMKKVLKTFLFFFFLEKAMMWNFVICIRYHKMITTFDTLIPLLGLYFIRRIGNVETSYTQTYLPESYSK